MMISFIVPAHNEEAWIGRCLSAIRTGSPPDAPHEIIVVDDASDDATAAIARQQGAQVIRVEHRQIAATRNAGAKAAHGEILFFVDADTLMNGPMIQAAMRSIREGAVGGGCFPRFDGQLPLWAKLTMPALERLSRWLNFPASGACQFCTRGAFEAVGGFDEKYYAAEDAIFATALKRLGRFVLLAETVVTSGRKVRAHSAWSLAWQLLRLILRGRRGLRTREGLDYWYKPAREKANAENQPGPKHP